MKRHLGGTSSVVPCRWPGALLRLFAMSAFAAWGVRAQAPQDSLSTIDLEDKTVHAEHAHGKRETSQASKALEGERLERVRGASLGHALQVLPGVTEVSTGATVSKPAVRGMTGNRVVILNNGIRQEGQQWGSEHAPEVDAFLASRLTLIQGASSVRYGSDAMGGVILVEPWPLPDQPGYWGEVYAIGNSNNHEGIVSASVEGLAKRWPALAGRLQFTAKKGGDLSAPGYGLANTGNEELNGSAALAYVLGAHRLEVFYSRFETKLGVLLGSHIGNVTDLKKAIERGSPEPQRDFTYSIGRPFQQVEHQLLKVQDVASLPNGNLSLTYSLQDNIRQEFDHKPLNDARARLNRPELEFEIMTHGAEMRWEGRGPLRSQLEAGLDGMAQYNVYAGRAFIPNYLSRSGGVFGIATRDIGRVSFETGARFDGKWIETYARENDAVEKNAFDYQNGSVMVGAHGPLGKLHEWRAHLATAFRPPGINELFSEGLHHGAASVEFGDRNLKSERAYDFTAEWRAQTPSFTWDVMAYRTYIDGFIYLKPVLPPTLTIRGAFPTFVYTQTPALLTGADFMGEWKLSGSWRLRMGGSWLMADDDASGKPLPLMPPPRLSPEFEYAWKPGWSRSLRHVTVTLGLRMVAEQTRIPDADQDYAPPPEGYALVDAGLETQWRLGNLTLHADVSVQNAADAAYRDYTDRLRYYADAPGRNVSLKLHLPFGSDG